MSSSEVPAAPADRWVVLAPVVTRPGTGLVQVVADRRWGRQKLWRVLALDGADEAFFRQRAEAWFELGAHPGIATAFGLWRLDGRLVLLLDIPRGEMLPTGPKVELHRAHALAVGIAGALAHAHAHGVCHGDLHSEHVWAAGDEIGLTGFVLEPPPLRVPRERIAATAPEAWLQPGLTPAADVYALGVLLYELYTGHRPFEVDDLSRTAWMRRLRSEAGTIGRLLGSFARRPAVEGLDPEHVELLAAPTLDDDSRWELMRALHAGVAPRSVREWREELPESLDALIRSCLEKDPARRPSAIEVQAALVELSGCRPSRAVASVETSNNRAVAAFEQGRVEVARELLEECLGREPSALVAWVNLRLLEIAADPGRLFQVLEEFERDVRPLHARQLQRQSALSSFLDVVGGQVLTLDGPVRSVAYAPDGTSVAIAGWFPSGVRVWELASRSRTRPLFGGRTWPCDQVVLLSARHAVVQAGQRITMVRVESGESLWSKRFADQVQDVSVAREGRIAVALRDRVLLLDADGAIDGWLGPYQLEEGQGLSRVALSPDGARLAWARGREIRIVQVDNERVVAGVELAGTVTSLRYGSDGARLFAADDRGAVVEVPIGEGAEVRELGRHDSPVRCLAVTLDGRWLVSGGRDGQLVEWDPAAGTRRELGRHPGAIGAISLDRDGNALVGDESGTVRLWRRERPELQLHFAVAESEEPTGGGIPRNVREGTLIIQDRGVSGGVILGVLNVGVDWSTRYTEPVGSTGFAADDVVLAACGTVAHLSRGKGRSVHVDAVRLEHEADLLSFAFHPDGRHLATGTGAPKGGDPDRLPGARLVVLSNPGFSFAIGPSGLTIGRERTRDTVLPGEGVSRRHCTILVRDGQYVVRDDGSANGVFVNSIRVFEDVLHDGDLLRIGQTELRFELTDEEEDELDENTTGLLLLKRGGDQVSEDSAIMAWEEDRDWRDAADAPPSGPGARIWDTGDGRRQKLVDHPLAVRALAWSPDGTRLATGCDDGRVRIWRSNTWEIEHTFSVSAEGRVFVRINAIAFGPDGSWLVAGCADGTTRIWDVSTKEQLHVLRGHRRAVWSAAFSPDGRRIVTGGGDGIARIWLTRTGECIGELQGHTGEVTAVTFSFDGRIVLTGSADGTARLWNVASNQLLETVDVEGEGVASVAFAPDGHRIATGSTDGTLRVWLVRWLWAFYEDTIGIAENLAAEPDTYTCMAWPTPPRKRDFEFWLDVWRDVLRCSAGASLDDEQRARLARLRTRIGYLLLDHLKGGDGGSVPMGVPMGLDTVGRGMPLDRVALELKEAALVDPDLAKELQARLA